MVYWREAKIIRGTLSFHSANWRVELHLRRDETNSEKFVGFLLRWEGGEAVRSREKVPELWTVLWPKTPIYESNFLEAKQKGLPLLEAASQYQDEHFTKQPYVPRVRPEEVTRIQRQPYALYASIRKHSENRFEVMYYGDLAGSQETGEVLAPPVDRSAFPENAWIHTFANSLEESVFLARAELEILWLQMPDGFQKVS